MKEVLMSGKKQEVLIDKKEFYRNLTRLALPIALQSLMLASVAAGDRSEERRVGKECRR